MTLFNQKFKHDECIQSSVIDCLRRPRFLKQNFKEKRTILVPAIFPINNSLNQ